MDLRRISLCNVAYKVMLKVPTNILKTVLKEIIHETQNTFVPTRLIIDNIMISYRVMYFMKRKTNDKLG